MDKLLKMDKFYMCKIYSTLQNQNRQMPRMIRLTQREGEISMSQCTLTIHARSHRERHR